MPAAEQLDVVVIGSGPNGFAAAIALAREGLAVRIVEARDIPGGGMRSLPLTVPGCIHDLCSAVHPLGFASPFFRTLSLERYGLTWQQPATPLAHVMADGRAVTLERSIEATAIQLGRDADAYRRLVTPFVENFDRLLEMVLGPLRVPASPLLFARFGLSALRSMCGLQRRHFTEERTGGLLGGIAAHAMVPLTSLGTASFALVLGLAGHAGGWPVARGGSRSIADALLRCFEAHGGELVTGERVTTLAQLPRARAYVFDVSPRELLSICGERLPPHYRRRVARFRHGPGVSKVDWALRGPIPWRDDACARSATVHLSGTLDDVTAAEAAVNRGELSPRPFVLVGQPGVCDPTRAPEGLHTGWAYCHVPAGSDVDASVAIEAEIERAAPGFRDLVLARHAMTAVELERDNPNYVGGDISGGVSDLWQLFFRPVARLDPYSTPAPDIFICSSSTPPGGGVHGMCGYWAARSVLARVFGRRRISAETAPA